VNSIIEHIIRGVRPMELVAANSCCRERAAVVAVILPVPGDLELLFIRRRVNPSDPWSGQVAFPGGRCEPGDRSLLDAAVREAMEEVGLDLRREGRFLGALGDVKPQNVPTLRVTPYLAAVDCRPSLRLGCEVEEAFWAPVKALKRVGYETMLSSGRQWRGQAFMYGRHIIWGLTGGIVEKLLSLL